MVWLFGAVLGIRGYKATAVRGASMVGLLVMLYYVVSTIGGAMGAAGELGPWSAAWLANLLLGVLAAGALLCRERSIPN